MISGHGNKKNCFTWELIWNPRAWLAYLWHRVQGLSCYLSLHFFVLSLSHKASCKSLNSKRQEGWQTNYFEPLTGNSGFTSPRQAVGTIRYISRWAWCLQHHYKENCQSFHHPCWNQLIDLIVSSCIEQSRHGVSGTSSCSLDLCTLVHSSLFHIDLFHPVSK